MYQQKFNAWALMRSRTFCLLLVLALVELAIHYWITLPASEINTYLARDIQRAVSWRHGYFTFAGPDFTSGAYAPGPFFYWILLPAILISSSTFFITGYLLTLKVIVDIWFSYFFSKKMKISFWAIYLPFSSVPILYFSLWWPNNAILSPTIAQICAILFFQYYEKRSKTYFTLTSILLGLCLHVHFSLIVLWPFFILIIHQVSSSKRRLFFDMSLFLALATLTLTPYFITAHFGPILGPLYPIKPLADYGVQSIFANWSSALYRTLTASQSIIRYDIDATIMAVLSIVVAIFAYNNFAIKSKKSFAIAIGIFTLMFVPWIFPKLTRRYYTVLFSISLSLVIFEITKSKIYLLKKNLILTLICVTCLFLRGLTYENAYKIFSGEDCDSCAGQMFEVCNYFNSKGVSFEDFYDNVFQIMKSSNESGVFDSKDCFKQIEANDNKKKRRYLYVDNKMAPSTNDLISLLARIPRELRDVYRHKNLKVEFQNRFVSIYSSEENPYLDQRISNASFAYEIDPARGVHFLKENALLINGQIYYARLCESPIFCDLYFNFDNVSAELTVKIVSRIAQTIYFLAPVTTHIQELQLHFNCDGLEKTVSLASSLGTYNDEFQNQTLFTPLVRKYPIQCHTFLPRLLSASSMRLVRENGVSSETENWTMPLKRLRREEAPF